MLPFVWLIGLLLYNFDGLKIYDYPSKTPFLGINYKRGWPNPRIDPFDHRHFLLIFRSTLSLGPIQGTPYSLSEVSQDY